MAGVLDRTKSDSRSMHAIVWHLAWPVIALNLLQTLNSLLDSYFLGKVGASAIAASGAAFNITFLLMGLAFALGTATTALVSRFFGADEQRNMIDASRQSVTLGLVIGIVLTILVALILPQLASLFADPSGPVYADLMRYVHPILFGVPAVFLFAIVAASLRAIGDTKRPMYVSGAQILLHIILNYLLIFPTREVVLHMEVFGLRLFHAEWTMPGAGLGIAGAGWAMTISAWFAAIVYFPVASRTILGPVWKLQWLSRGWVWRIIRIAAPASLSALIRISSMSAFMLVLKHTVEGEKVYGAVRVGFAMESIAFMPAFGYMVAASALVGQSLGMKDPDRAERLGWAAAMQTFYIILVLSVLFFIFAPWFSGLFLHDPLQHEAATNYLRIIAITEVMFGFGVVFTGALQGAGDTIRPTVVTLVVQLGLRAPAAWLFAVYLGHNSTGAWWVMSATQAIGGAVMIWLFKQGKWKLKEV